MNVDSNPTPAVMCDHLRTNPPLQGSVILTDARYQISLCAKCYKRQENGARLKITADGRLLITDY